MIERITLSPAEAAEAIGVSRSTLYAIMKRSDCDFAFTVGRRRLVSRDKLEAWVERQTERSTK